MPYVRHRKRMVAQSVYTDLQARLTVRGWKTPTVPPLLEGQKLVVISAFPDDTQGDKTAMNTLAVNNGEKTNDLYEEEMGGGLYSQEYTFHFAFYAISDAAADALFQDLHDEWAEAWIPLYNYAMATPTFVVNMEVESFAWTQAPEQLTIAGKRIHFGRLILTDFMDRIHNDEG